MPMFLDAALDLSAVFDPANYQCHKDTLYISLNSSITDLFGNNKTTACPAIITLFSEVSVHRQLPLAQNTVRISY